MELMESGEADAVAAAEGGDAGAVEGFVGVDVADASEDGLVEKGRFDAGAFGADVLGELVGCKAPRFGAEFGVGGYGVVDGPQSGPSSGVVEFDAPVVVEVEGGSTVSDRVVFGVSDVEGAGHSHVEHEVRLGLVAVDER